jgi:hypothetical protein
LDNLDETRARTIVTDLPRWEDIVAKARAWLAAYDIEHNTTLLVDHDAGQAAPTTPIERGPCLGGLRVDGVLRRCSMLAGHDGLCQYTSTKEDQ